MVARGSKQGNGEVSDLPQGVQSAAVLGASAVRDVHGGRASFAPPPAGNHLRPCWLRVEHHTFDFDLPSECPLPKRKAVLSQCHSVLDKESSHSQVCPKDPALSAMPQPTWLLFSDVHTVFERLDVLFPCNR